MSHFTPFLPRHQPLARDPLLIWLWAAIAVALAPAISRMVGSGALTRLPPRRAASLAGVLAAVAFGLGTWAVAPQHPDGDEPHYLVITQSTLEDHDLKIENNHREVDYRASSPFCRWSMGARASHDVWLQSARRSACCPG